jgi:hypothetical protein
MTTAEQKKLAKMLKKLKEEMKPKVGMRSTVSECVDFLLAVLGEKV